MPSSLPKRCSTQYTGTHPQHHRHQTTTIKNPSYQQHAPTKNNQAGMHILRTCRILQKILQGLCKDDQALNLINPPQDQIGMDSSTPYIIYDAEGSHYTGTYLILL